MIEFSGPGMRSKDNRIVIKPHPAFLLDIMQDGYCLNCYDIMNIDFAVDDHMVRIGNEKAVRVVEHLFSALYGLDIFGIKLEVWGEEFPIYDGSSLEYAKKLYGQVHEPMPTLKIDRPVTAASGDSFLHFVPGSDPDLTIAMEFSHPYISTQKINITVNRENYITEIAPARTFKFTTEDDEQLKDLPTYGIGITSSRIHSREPLRFADEQIRHKILDLLGDLYFTGGRLRGSIRARNTYHLLNHDFVKKIKATISKQKT